MKYLKLLLILTLVILCTSCNKNIDSNIKDVKSNIEKDNSQNKDEKNNLENNDDYGIVINEYTVTFTDSRGEEVTINKNPERVVCLYNSFLEIWDICGGAVVGRMEESDEKIVDNVKDAEIVGSLSAPSLEKILSLNPDLIIMSGSYASHAGMIPTFEQSNIQVVSITNDFLEDYYRTLRLFTSLTGREDLYEKNMEEVKSNVDKIINNAPKDKNYKVLILFASAKNVTVRNSNSMVGEMLKNLNTINISDIGDMISSNNAFSMETILKEDPDFIFVQTMGSDQEKILEKLKEETESNPAWASLKAVKEGKYIILPRELYLYKPNQRYAEAYEGLAKILYPEIKWN